MTALVCASLRSVGRDKTLLRVSHNPRALPGFGRRIRVEGGRLVEAEP